MEIGKDCKGYKQFMRYPQRRHEDIQRAAYEYLGSMSREERQTFYALQLPEKRLRRRKGLGVFLAFVLPAAFAVGVVWYYQGWDKAALATMAIAGLFVCVVEGINLLTRKG